MPDQPTPPVELGYSTFSAGTLNWQRHGDLLHITVNEPPTPARSAAWWWRTLAVWAGTFVAAIAGFSVTYGVGPVAARAAILLATVLVAGHTALIVIGHFAGPSRRHLQIRVSRDKLLIDECGTSFGGHGGVAVSVRGRAWAADEITSVTAADGSLRVRTRTRLLARMSITAYDPADLAFAADAIRKVLAGGVDAWVQSQRPAPAPLPTS